MEWIEVGLREALAKDACRIIESLLNESGLDIPGDRTLEGEHCYANRPKEVLTLFGPITLRRNYYYQSEKGRVPMDEALGLVEGYSPGTVRLMCRAGTQQGYEMASKDLKAFTGLEIEGREIQRMVKRMGIPLQQWLDLQPGAASVPAFPVMYISADGTGVPMVREELEGRRGKQTDGSAKTREVKLGVVFTQHVVDEEGCPLRDPESSSYVGGFETAEPFGLRLRNEARRRGLGKAREIVFIGDGAKWVWEVRRQNFSGAVEILDFYHATEHLGLLSQAIFGTGTEKAKRFQKKWGDALLGNRVEKVLQESQAMLPRNGPRRQAAMKQLEYFRNNKNRMKYQTYRQKGYFIGSGVVEAGCKTVIGKRLKQSGMFWSEPGAQSVINMRCALLSSRFDDFWNQRSQAALAA